MSAPEPTVIHAYGVVRAGDSAQLPGRGIGGAPLGVVVVEDLAAVVSGLPEDQYGEAVWRAHAEDPDWLGVVAAEHNAVLEAVIDQTDVLPLRLPSLYRHRDALEAELRANARPLAAAFDAVSGHVEWGIKVFLVEEPDAPEPARPASGRDYLTRKASASSRKEAARDRRARLLLDAHEEIARAAADQRVNAPQDPALSGRKEPMLLNAAYLVPRAERDAFLDEADRLGEELAGEGMRLEVTGPWPPYNFSERVESSDAGNGARA
jgi:hypothetical protein